MLESLLKLFWWPFLPLFHCEKECLSVLGVRRLFWVVFFLLAVHLVAMYGRKPISQPQKNRISRHRYTKVRFSRKNPPFYLKHVLKLRPCKISSEDAGKLSFYFPPPPLRPAMPMIMDISVLFTRIFFF